MIYSEQLDPSQAIYKAESISPADTLAQKYGDLLASWYGEQTKTQDDRIYQVQGILRSDLFITASLGEEAIGVLGLTLHTPPKTPLLFALLKEYPSLQTIVEIQEFAVANNFRGKGISKSLWKKAIDTTRFDAMVTETRNPLSAAAIASSLSQLGMHTYWANEHIGGPTTTADPQTLKTVSDAYIRALYPNFLADYERYQDGIVPFEKFSAPTKDPDLHISDQMDFIMKRILKRQQETQKIAIGLLIGIR